MVEAQENKINETKEADFSDLQSLLEAANLSKFNPELGYTEEKREFEKFENFFEIVKSNVDEEAQSKKDEPDETEEVSDTVEESQKDILDERELVNSEEFEQKENLEEDSEQAYEQTGNIETAGTEHDDVSVGVLEQISSTEQSEEEHQAAPDALDNKDDNKLSPEEVDQSIVEIKPFSSDLEKNAYEMGHKDALEEFERSMGLEKKSLQELTVTLFAINDKLQQATESLLKEKLFELFDELIGEKLDEFEETFVAKIKAASKSIIALSNAIKLELNHSDFKILKSNVQLESLGFEISEKSDLRRGEFRIFHDSSGFQQKLNG